MVEKVTVRLGARDRELRYTPQSLTRLQRTTGMTMQQIGARIMEGHRTALAAMLHAALLHAERDVTVLDVVRMLDHPDTAMLAVCRGAFQALRNMVGPAMHDAQDTPIVIFDTGEEES